MKEILKKMILAVSLLILLIILLTGCSVQDKTPSADLTLEEIVERLCDGVDVPPYETVTLDRENFEYFTFVPYEEGLTAVAADALVNITPHSLVVIRTENGHGSELAEKVAAGADLNKWLCVGSEAGNTAYTEHYVVLIMSDRNTVDAITENFRTLSEELDDTEMHLITLRNMRYDYEF